MLNLAIAIGFAALALSMLLAFLRLLRGPDLPDRILALDTLYINAIALIVLCGIALGSKDYIEAALLIAMTGFVGTVMYAQLVCRQHKDES